MRGNVSGRPSIHGLIPRSVGARLPLRRLTADPLISPCVSHCAGKVLAETAKSETVCKPMRGRGRVFRACASTTSMISSRYYIYDHISTCSGSVSYILILRYNHTPFVY